MNVQTVRMGSQGPARGRRRSSGFTLVELLVVIAIVGVLLSVLLPSLASARVQARAAVCASNIRQLAIANDLYAQDHAQHYAPGMPERVQNLRRWHGARPDQASGFSVGVGAGGTLSPYIQASASSNGPGTIGTIRSCPSFESVLRSLNDAAASGSDAGFERGCGGYGYNSAFVGTLVRSVAADRFVIADDRSGSPTWAFATPVRTIAFADTALAAGPPIGPAATGGLIEFSFAEPRFWPEFPGLRPDPSVHFRHGAAKRPAASIMWLDGHVGTEHRAFAHASGFYAADPAELNVGWPGDEDSNDLFDFR